MGEVRVDVTSAGSAADFTAWATKKAATCALKKLREQGLNVDDCVRIHPAHNRFFQFWVIARPDALAEMTWLMRADGSWVRGRLHDGWDSTTWTHIPPAGGARIEPTFTHVTKTVPYHGRKERYRTKSNGSCGRWVMSDDSVALCACGWTSYAGSRSEAQASAQSHRANPEPATAANAA